MSMLKRGVLPALLISCLVFPLARAQAAKPLLDTILTFSQDGTAKVSHLSYEKAAKNAETDKIESALIFYALVMNKLDDAGRKALLSQVQASVGKIATQNGLVRADLIQGSPLVKPLGQAPNPPSLKIVFAELPAQGHTLEFQPPDTGNLPLAAGVLYFFQDLTRDLSERGLRLMVLAMGGMNKWYREIGQAASPESVSQAPSYGLTVAVEILEKVGGMKK
jgi:hypothetical protein